MRLDWSRELPAPALGIGLAREPGTLLVFDAERMLTRLDRTGQIELRRPAPATLTAAVITDEGRHVAAIGRRGQVWLLSAEFDVIWQRSVSSPVAVAIDHLGRAVAVADGAGGLHVFDDGGQELWRTTTARPLRYLAYVAEAGALVGAADLGLVCAFDRRGEIMWRDGLMANVGSLAVSGDGRRIALACFSEGLCCYALERPKQERLSNVGVCRLVGLGYTGEPVVSVGLDHRVTVRDGRGASVGELVLPHVPAALVVSALGDWAAVTAERGVMGIELAREPAKG